MNDFLSIRHEIYFRRELKLFYKKEISANTNYRKNVSRMYEIDFEQNFHPFLC